MPRYFFLPLLLLALFWSPPANAGNVPIGGGGSCTGMTITDPVASTQGQQQAFDDGLYTCTGTSWVPEALIVGGVDQSNSAPSCNSTNAGMVKWTGSVLQYCDGSTWQTLSSSATPAMILISTQTASSSASLSWTGLGSTYNTLFLNCTGLLFSSNGATPHIYVGEGAGPTWKTATNYTNSQVWAGGYGSSTTAPDILWTSGSTSTTVPMLVKLYIDNAGSSSIYKNFVYDVNNPASFSTSTHGWGYWNNDTNPITALEIVPSSGTISSGQCSLYGLNH